MNNGLVIGLHEYCFLSRGLAHELGVPRVVLGPRRGDTQALFQPLTTDVAGKTVVVVWSYSITEQTDYHTQFFRIVSIVQHLALKGAETIIGVCPFLLYGRNSASGEMGQVSMHVLAAAGMQRLITLHAPTLTSAGTMRLTSLPFHAPWHTLLTQLMTAPGMQRNAGEWLLVALRPHLTEQVNTIAQALGVEAVTVTTERFADESVIVSGAKEVFRGRRVFLLDDVIFSGRTVLSVAHFAFRGGAREVFVGATHGIFSGHAHAQLSRSDISKLFVSNLLSDERRLESRTIFSIAMDSAFVNLAATAVRKSERLRGALADATAVVSQ